MKSGSIVFSVNADDSKAQEKLDSLKEKIRGIEKEIEEKRTARNAIAEDLSIAKERAEAARKEVEQLRVAMQESKAITDQAGSRMNAQQFKEYIGRLDKQKEISAELAKQEQILKENENTVSKLVVRNEQALSAISNGQPVWRNFMTAIMDTVRESQNS